MQLYCRNYDHDTGRRLDDDDLPVAAGDRLEVGSPAAGRLTTFFLTTFFLPLVDPPSLLVLCFVGEEGSAGNPDLSMAVPAAGALPLVVALVFLTPFFLGLLPVLVFLTGWLLLSNSIQSSAADP